MAGETTEFERIATQPTLQPGYHGQYLSIDLTSRRATAFPIDRNVLRRFVGGTGLATYLVLRHDGPRHDALDPAAPLVFGFSPLVGSPLTTSAKFVVVSRSPLTNLLNDSLVSSTFALAGKRTGYDALVITGRAPTWSLLVIDDHGVRLIDASDLQGTPTGVGEARIAERLGPSYAAAVIGPAGERGVRYASISHAGRHAGRGGGGAVMGAKRLKGIAVAGSQRVDWFDYPRLTEAARRLSHDALGPATEKYRELGTAANLRVLNRLGALPVRNFQDGSCAGATTLDESLRQATDAGQVRVSCAACNIGCEHRYQVATTSGRESDVRIEYENLFALGPLCGIDQADAVLRASQRCDQLGLDTISTGGTIAFAMECVERKLLDVPWLRFGDGEALLRAIDQIGCGEGIGSRLAEGSRRLAKQLGPIAQSIAPHVKGMEIPGYEPRAAHAMALGYAVGTRGADHNRSGAYQVDFSEHVDRYQLTVDDVARVIETEDQATLLDSLIFCKFLRGALTDLFAEGAKYLGWATGWDVTVTELRTTAQRIITAKKLFNVGAGWRPEDDWLPDRLLSEPQSGEPRARLSENELRALIIAYNRLREWRDDGTIPSQLFTKLDLSEFDRP